MTESLTELKLEVEKAEPTRVPSETRTIRLEGDVFPKLEELAEQENVSISFIINKALRRHVEWQIYAEKFGFMMAFTANMRRIFESLTDLEARDLGSEYARSFKFEHSFDGSVHTIIFKHDRGPRTSAFFAEIAKVLFNRLNLKVDAVESDQQLSIIVRN